MANITLKILPLQHMKWVNIINWRTHIVLNIGYRSSLYWRNHSPQVYQTEYYHCLNVQKPKGFSILTWIIPSSKLGGKQLCGLCWMRPRTCWCCVFKTTNSWNGLSTCCRRSSWLIYASCLQRDISRRRIIRRFRIPTNVGSIYPLINIDIIPRKNTNNNEHPLILN